MTAEPGPHWTSPAGLSALLYLIALVIFVLGAFGVHLGSVSHDRWTDLGLAFVAAGLLV